ncbi:BppU family phage baseplate upper protein [Enterococcus faecium]|uniref:BppU family phage baseplate upper protein n=1 Tax=Enterococcus faecium TaxID=1352 RepID=UPI00296B50EC|nr:BppU family phage baseplate upper protein [Enterococcus faecium]MDW3608466.1 BppU family phage baseplate upper protein [Enterococcus faecium]
MAHIIKKGPIKVPTQPKDFDLQATGLVFKSYDNQIALEFNVAQQDGAPADLLGANLRLLMFIYDEVDGTIKKEPIPFITKNLITESFLNGHVVYILPEAMKAYNGMVEAYVYIEYPDGSTSDNLGFTFRMKRSAIDGLAQDKADYFIEDFKQLLAAASLEADKVIEGLDTEIKNLQQAAQDANTAVDGAMDRIDGLEAEIGQLERLREMYIDTLDFEGYDYSGRPNVSANLDASCFSSGAGAEVVDDNDEIVFTLDGINQLSKYTPRAQTPLAEGKEYTISCEIMLETGFTGDPSGIRLQHAYLPGGNVELYTTTVPKYELNTWQKLVGTRTTTKFSNTPNEWYPLFRDIKNLKPTGKVRLRNIKIEEGDQATPFQPNLLAEPYNMCREYPNENIADPRKVFPIRTNIYNVYLGKNTKNYQVGKKYTATLKGSKPSTQNFSGFLLGGSLGVGNFKPVEGVPNLWKLTFTVTDAHIKAGATNLFSIYQMPQDSIGQCEVEWLKIEEGEVSTPIDVPTYKGLGILDSNDPTKYVWNYTELVDVDGIQDALENVEQRTATLEGKANTIDGRLNNVNTALNTVQSTADQILAEVTAADVMKETDLPGYLANKPIVAGGMADFAGKVAFKLHPNPHRAANYALAYEHANQAPSKCFTYECSQTSYDRMKSLDGNVLGTATNTAGQTGTTAFKFDLISQITKDFPSFFDDCLTQGEKVMKIRNYIESAVLTIRSKNTNSECYISVAQGDVWGAEVKKGSYNESAVTEKVYDQLVQNLYTRARVQDDGSIIFRARTRTIQASETNVTVKQEVDYARLDYTLNLSSDDFLTPIERDVTKDNLTQILSDDSATIKGVMDFKFKTRGNNDLCPHAAYLKSTSAQATNMSEITYEADADMYTRTQNKDDGLASVLRPEATTGYVGQAKYKFDLVIAIEKEHPHLFKGLTTTKQKVDVLKAKMQEMKFNIWCRTEGSAGTIEIGSSLANVDAIDTLQVKDVGQTTEFARAEFYSNNNYACARRINDDGTILYFVHGSKATTEQPQPKVIIDYVNLEYTLSDKPSDYIVAKTDATYLAAVAKTKELDRYKEYFSKGTSLGVDTINQTTIPFGTSMGLHGTRVVTLNGGVFTATKQCKLLFDFSIKMRGNDKTGYIYVKPYKNGEKVDEEACAAVGGFRDSTGATATLKFQNNTPLKYIAELNTGDTLEFKVEIGSSDKIQEVKMLFGTVEEI